MSGGSASKWVTCKDLARLPSSSEPQLGPGSARLTRLGLARLGPSQLLHLPSISSRLVARAQVLYELVRRKHVGADLRSPIGLDEIPADERKLFGEVGGER